MSIKKFGATLVAVLALAGLAATSASATISTTAAEWYTGAAPGTTLPVGTSKAVTASAGVVWSFTSTLLEAPVKLTATGIECVSCVIKNEAVTSKTPPVAVGEGKIKFTGVTVDTPAGCTVETAGLATPNPGTVEALPLKIHADWMDTTVTNQKAFVQIFPVTAPNFAQLRFTAETGKSCPLSGPYNVTGSLFGESTNNTGVQAASQGLNFNATIQTTAGASLLWGAKPATLSGSASFEMGGTTFGIH
jgi:hypothetical protein